MSCYWGRCLAVGTGIACLVVLSPGVARAQGVTVDLELAAAQPIADLLGYTVEDLEAILLQQIEQAFGLLGPKEFLQALSDTQAFANRGLGVDYASNQQRFVFGVAGNLPVRFSSGSAGGLSSGDSNNLVSRLATNISVMAGANLSSIGREDIALYTNLFLRGSNAGPLTSELQNVGFHVQLKSIGPEYGNERGLFAWGGVDFTAGVVYSRLKLTVDDEVLELPLPLESINDFIETRLINRGTLFIETTAFSLPMEVSTNIRLLRVLSLFSGVGFDMQLGGSRMDVRLNSELFVPDGGPSDGILLARTAITASEKGRPSFGQIRFFTGAQLNISALRLFVQSNMMPNKAINVAFGVRVAW
ncbi:MAG: hypothetical protein R3C68_03555 [Myxococcota bacterium]